MKRTKLIVLGMAMLFALQLHSQTPTEMPTGKKFYIQSAINYGKNNGGYWDVPGYPNEIQKGSNIQVFDLDEGHDRTFTLHRSSPEGYYEIQIGNTSRSRIDIQGAGKGNGTSVKTWDRNGKDHQRFLFHHLGNGRFKIFDKNSGKAICLAGRSNSNRSNVHIWDDHNGPWMEWYLIDVQTKKPFIPKPQQQQQQQQQHNNMIPLPEGKVVVPSGYNVQDVEVRFFLDKYRNTPITTKPNASGYYSFPNAQIDENDWHGLVVAVADGLVSDHYAYHKTIAPGNIELKLTVPKQGSTLIYSQHLGNLEFTSNSKYLTNVKGTVVSDRDDFFFRNLTRETPQKSNLRELIGVSGTEAKTDKEIYDIAKQTWEFFGKKNRSVMGNAPDDVKKAFDESLNRERINGPVTFWTTVEQFVDIYNKYGFIPVGNCTSYALTFAAFLRVAGIPANKMAVQRMHTNAPLSSEHWAVIIEMNNVWYWFDPQRSRNTPFPSFEQLTSIPSTHSIYEYHIPFEIVTLPGSTINYVPHCGEEGVIK